MVLLIDCNAHIIDDFYPKPFDWGFVSFGMGSNVKETFALGLTIGSFGKLQCPNVCCKFYLKPLTWGFSFCSIHCDVKLALAFDIMVGCIG